MISPALRKIISVPMEKVQPGLHLILLISILGFPGCSFQKYSEKPLSPVETAGKFQARSLQDAGFQNYLQSQGYSNSQSILNNVGLPELVYSAMYFHSDLDVARSQWRAAQSKLVTAGEKINPGISGSLEHHSRTDGGISPWTYGLAIDLSIETANKRQVRIEEASHLTEAARIELAQSAWQLRSAARNALLDWHVAQEKIALLGNEIAIRREIADMLQKRLDLGMASSTELSNARILLQKAQHLQDLETGQLAAIRSRIAASAGLSNEALAAATFNTGMVAQRYPPATLPGQELRRAALLNRLDIRAAIARYAVAESRLKLQIARQYPDIVLSPGYTYDQGDNLWSLGLSTLLQLFNRNEGPIAEAMAGRDLEAARFLKLQSEAIGMQEMAVISTQAAWDALASAEKTFSSQQQAYEKLHKQFDAGQIDRLELASARLELATARTAVLSNEWSLFHAYGNLEDAIQKPLNQVSAQQPPIESMLPEHHSASESSP